MHKTKYAVALSCMLMTIISSNGFSAGGGIARSASPEMGLASRDDFQDVVDQIARYKAAGRPVILVIGAPPSERDHFDFGNFSPERAPERAPGVIYFDDIDETERGARGPSAKGSGHFIHGNFNDLDLLTRLARLLPDSFDHIIVDVSVAKFMHLKPVSVRAFFELLAPGGAMICDYPSSHNNFSYALFGEKRPDGTPIDGGAPAILNYFKTELLNQKLNEHDELGRKIFIKYRNVPQQGQPIEYLTERSRFNINAAVNDIYAEYLARWKAINLPQDNAELYTLFDQPLPLVCQSFSKRDAAERARNQDVLAPKDLIVLRKKELRSVR